MKAKSVKYVLLGMALVLGLAMPVQAQLAAVGPVDPVTGFPIWFEDAAGLRLQLCDEFDPEGVADEQPPCLPELIDPTLGVVDGNIGEALYYAAVAEFEGPDGEDFAIECVVEAAGGTPNVVLNVALIRFEFFEGVNQGDYEVVAPCGTFNFNHPTDTQDDNFRFRDEIAAMGVATEAVPFASALPGPVQIFASNGTGAPGFLGDALTAAPLLSPLRPGGVTEVTVTGPIDQQTANLFMVVGKISGCTEDNEAPVARDDWAGTAAGTPVVIDVLANDTDVIVTDPTAEPPVTEIISPPVGTVAIVTPPALASGTAVVNPDNTVTFTPAVDFIGPATFTYTVTDPCGLISDPATVTVLVEGMEFKAEYRTRTGTWTLAGGGNIPDLSFVAEEGVTAFYTTLTSAQEVPPRTSAGSGEAIVTMRGVDLVTVIDYTLTYSGLAAVTQSHIHNGGVGVNGPVNVFLCTNLELPGTFPESAQVPPPCPTTAGTVTGTLTIDDFIAAGAVETFEELLAAIDAGGTYVNVHTEAFPPGEIRGQVGVNVISLRAGTDGPAIGAVAVQPDGDWNFSGKVNLAPTEASDGILAESAAGVSTTRQLRLR